MYITMSVKYSLKENIYIYITAWIDRLLYIDHLKVLFHIEKDDKYLDNYRSYGRASSFVLRVDWMAEVQEYDMVAAVLGFTVYVFESCYSGWFSCFTHFQLNLVA